MHQVSLPTDTSGGVFNTLSDVSKQDAAAAAHYPVLANRFSLLSDTVKSNEKTDRENAQDISSAISDIQGVLDDVIQEDEESIWPF